SSLRRPPKSRSRPLKSTTNPRPTTTPSMPPMPRAQRKRRRRRRERRRSRSTDSLSETMSNKRNRQLSLWQTCSTASFQLAKSSSTRMSTILTASLARRSAHWSDCILTNTTKLDRLPKFIGTQLILVKRSGRNGCL
ncbi:hypothetical protein HDU99_009532, partial [Rhizoclosmatium hyalinum]